jgi:SpoVK/Ycf46/Vps4 family AAA+-type ATPase
MYGNQYQYYPDHFCVYRLELDRIKADNDQLKQVNAKLEMDLVHSKIKSMYYTSKRKTANHKRNLRKKRKLNSQADTAASVDEKCGPPGEGYLALSEEEVKKELTYLFKKLLLIEDVVALGKHPNLACLKSNEKMRELVKLIPALKELHEMIGLSPLKKQILQYVLSRIQFKSRDIQHIVILGQSGLGKTKLAHILAKLMHALGIISGNNVVEGSRSNMISKYLGHTAEKTQKVIDKAKNGVLIIDEVYSLGHVEGRDSFSKECVDTLNAALDDRRKRFVCIVAGYEKEVQDCFFAQNPGLGRRFTEVFKIAPYSASELFQIFKQQVEAAEWKLQSEIKVMRLIEKNLKQFKYHAGDMMTLFKKAQLACGTRSARESITCSTSAVLSYADVKSSLNALLAPRKVVAEKQAPGHLYM